MDMPTLDLAATPRTRNRAVDAYRAAAMCAVTVGHWLAAAVVVEADGSLGGRNALDAMPGLHWLTWLFQVMPLFFCLGGFANAASLDAQLRRDGRRADWVAARLRRLTQPTAILAGTWLTVLAASAATGTASAVVAAASAIAAIPLWFLANYVVDTALAPVTLRLHRRHGARFAGGLLATCVALEVTRLAGVPYLSKVNIVLGWMFFQVLGFWWRDGMLPAGRRLLVAAGGSLGTAAALVALGPWPLALVTVPGADFSNTWPPSLALVAYGIGTCALAIAAAPAVTRLLERRPRAWFTVAAANTITMTVYLWHFSAITIAGGAFYALGLIGDAPIGSASWWATKAAMMVAAFGVLSVIVRLVGGRERAGLLAADEAEGHGVAEIAAVALLLAAGFEAWTLAQGDEALAVAGMAALLVGRAALTRPTSRSRPFVGRFGPATAPGA